jgi:uncharacterized protein involved in exopolysaccharide biosynthesis
LQILSNFQVQLSAASVALDRAQQEKTYLESAKAQFQELQDVPADPDSQLRILRAKLAELESEFTPLYPDVVSTKEQIAQLEATKKQGVVDQVAADDHAANNRGDRKVTALNSGDPSRVIDAESRLKATEIEIADRQKDIQKIQSNIAKLESRLNATPIREEELASVTRDTEDARQNYQSLFDKKTQSELASNMEEHQQGEQFRVIDPPSFPQKPTEPNRTEIILGGWMLGLVVSGALTALGESAETRLRDERELRSCAPLPVLALIPTVRSQREEKLWTFYRNIEVAGAVLLILLSAGTILYTYLVG